MRSLLLVFFLFTISASLFAEDWTGFSGCGTYEVSGTARSLKKSLVILVNEKSKSEMIINVPIINEPMLAPYLDKPILATLDFDKSKSEGTVKIIKSRIPNPLNPMDTGIKLMSKADCK